MVLAVEFCLASGRTVRIENPEFYGYDVRQYTAETKELRFSGGWVQLPWWAAEFTELETLDCSYNYLGKLPNWIRNFRKLRVLKCCYNNISEIPDAIGYCTELRQFICEFNDLVCLPPSIAKCTKLWGLFVSRNQITELPGNIHECVNLSMLYIHNNWITSLPPKMYLLRYMCEFLYTDNPIENIPINVQRWIDNVKKLRYVEEIEVDDSMKTAVEELCALPETRCDIETLPFLDDAKALVREYIVDETVHPTLFVTYADVFYRSITRFRVGGIRDGYTNLEWNVLAGKDLCPTGRIEKLVARTACLNQVARESNVSGDLLLTSDVVVGVWEPEFT